jgi:2OG-Fe(II) oxygenase superfamily
VQLNPAVIEEVESLATRFSQRDPFRHIVIDDFLAPDSAAALLREFPPFERGNALNEAGLPGLKSTIEQIGALGGSYAELDRLVQSAPFLDWLSTLTGIPDLLYDPHYFGGGTHENKAGQDLDVHIDFNRHPIENWHRRLNLIVYLNPVWDPAFGGCLELHSDPRRADDVVRQVSPDFNRCVVFETTENSWHGFSRISFPTPCAQDSRRSIALYFYTRERPDDELADTHSTVYVDRPLPPRFCAGLTLSDADVEQLQSLWNRRMQHHQMLYREITALRKQCDQLAAARHPIYNNPLRRLGGKVLRALGLR